MSKSNKKYFLALYTVDDEKCLGVYEDLSDFIKNYYGITPGTIEFVKKRKSLHTILLRKKRNSKNLKWTLHKIKIEDEESGK